MSTTNFSGGETQTTTFYERRCPPSFGGGPQLDSISLSALHILLSITAFLGNSLILIALRKESSLHPPSKLLYSCLATTDLLVGLVAQPLQATYWMSIVHEHWRLCRYLKSPTYITSYALCGVSLSTMTAISVDRLLALLLGLRYRQIVTLRRMYIVVATFLVLILVASSSTFFDHRITIFLGIIVTSFCLVILLASYTKIFHSLRYQQHQVQDHVQQQPRQLNGLNMARYRKAVYSALWVQLAFVVCYAPFYIVEIVIGYSKRNSSHAVIARRVAIVLVYFNSTLNPFLYCWKISEVRQVVKQTIRQALCCLWS